jgi:GT2 family glycosyltransferase
MIEDTPHALSQPLASLAPSVGLPVTICVVCYGRHLDLAERFLSSLYGCTDPTLFRLRAGLNEVEPATRALFETYSARFGNIELYVEPRNIFKNPLMRRLFYEPAVPSRWTIWCDDDTHFTRRDWLQRLATKIEANPEAAMWGSLFRLWRRDEFILDWIRAATWYKGVPCMRGPDPTGTDAMEFRFATGGFWAARTAILRQLAWPDPRLIHASEDFLLGEAMRQSNCTIASFDYGVKINDAPRRNDTAPEVCALQAGNKHEK